MRFMKPPRAANLSMILAVAGWLFIAAAIFNLTGSGRVKGAGAFVGIGLLLTSIWLSGYVFATAKRRALFALVVVLIPIFLVRVGFEIAERAHRAEFVRTLKSQGVQFTADEHGNVISCKGQRCAEIIRRYGY